MAYKPGTLEARGMKVVRKSVKKIVTKIETTGEPLTIVLSPDRSAINADGEDVSVVNVSVLEEKGREVPDAMNLIRFELKGEGRIIGVGNGDPSSHEADKCAAGSWQRRLFNGKCQLIVQSPRSQGSMEVVASSDNMKPAMVIIAVEGGKVREEL